MLTDYKRQQDDRQRGQLQRKFEDAWKELQEQVWFNILSLTIRGQFMFFVWREGRAQVASARTE